MSWKQVKSVFLGKTLQNTDLEGEKLGRFWGVSIMASDAVSSVAYAIEEMLIILVPTLGLSAVGYLGYAAAPIIILVLVLAFSYSQIISSYPNGGGAYVVSSENISRSAALVAAAALIVDYVMTVAVSLSSATAALISAFPQLHDLRVPLAMLFLCVITLFNLRGMRESSKVFGIPTYAFILVMGLLLGTGFIKMAAGTLQPVHYPADVVTETGAGAGMGAVSLMLLLKAFASGCSALTGVEVVSNAVPTFKAPAQHHAKQVLFILVGIIVVIFGGSVLLVTYLGVIPLEGKTVISQAGLAVFGDGPMFYVLQFATSLILLIAANTAYNGLPTLLAILAEDGYMPRQFMHRGARLSFSNGILFIFAAGGLLLLIFRANTHRLIPMYAVGVFLSFTLSQGGMVARWLRVKGKGYVHKLLINGFGALMTATGTVIVFMTKFTQGAWALAIIIPAIAYMMHRIEKHYEFVASQLEISDFMARYHKSESKDNNLCIVLVGALNRSALKAVNYANLLSANVVALHVATDEKAGEELQAKWRETGIDIPLEVITSPYREIIEPIEAYLAPKEEKLRPGEMITMVMPRFMEKPWFVTLLHNQTAYRIEQRMRTHRDIATVMVPYIYSSASKPAPKPGSQA